MILSVMYSDFLPVDPPRTSNPPLTTIQSASEPSTPLCIGGLDNCAPAISRTLSNINLNAPAISRALSNINLSTNNGVPAGGRLGVSSATVAEQPIVSKASSRHHRTALTLMPPVRWTLLFFIFLFNRLFAHIIKSRRICSVT